MIIDKEVIPTIFLYNIEKAIGSRVKKSERLLIGHSLNKTFRITDNQEKKYLVKCRAGHSFRQEYETSIFLSNRGIQIQIPVSCGGDPYDYIIYEWVDGTSIEFIELDRYETSIALGKQLARILVDLHSCRGIRKLRRPKLADEVQYYINQINLYTENVSYMDWIISELVNGINEIPDLEYDTLVHMDLHSGNLICSNDNSKITIIDCENFTVTDPWREFTYAFLFHEPKEHLFWYTAILYYFNQNIPSVFYKKAKIYSYIQFLRILLHETKRSPESAVVFGEKAGNTLYKNFISSSNCVPKWMERYEGKKREIVNIADNM